MYAVAGTLLQHVTHVRVVHEELIMYCAYLLRAR